MLPEDEITFSYYYGCRLDEIPMRMYATGLSMKDASEMCILILETDPLGTKQFRATSGSGFEIYDSETTDTWIWEREN